MFYPLVSIINIVVAIGIFLWAPNTVSTIASLVWVLLCTVSANYLYYKFIEGRIRLVGRRVNLLKTGVSPMSLLLPVAVSFFLALSLGDQILLKQIEKLSDAIVLDGKKIDKKLLNKEVLRTILTIKRVSL